jgi:hypothetical protein
VFGVQNTAQIKFPERRRLVTREPSSWRTGGAERALRLLLPPRRLIFQQKIKPLFFVEEPRLMTAKNLQKSEITMMLLEFYFADLLERSQRTEIILVRDDAAISPGKRCRKTEPTGGMTRQRSFFSLSRPDTPRPPSRQDSQDSLFDLAASNISTQTLDRNSSNSRFKDILAIGAPRVPFRKDSFCEDGGGDQKMSPHTPSVIGLCLDQLLQDYVLDLEEEDANIPETFSSSAVSPPPTRTFSNCRWSPEPVFHRSWSSS